MARLECLAHTANKLADLENETPPLPSAIQVPARLLASLSVEQFTEMRAAIRHNEQIKQEIQQLQYKIIQIQSEPDWTRMHTIALHWGVTKWGENFEVLRTRDPRLSSFSADELRMKWNEIQSSLTDKFWEKS
jgi:hypothetical protein